MKRRDPFAAIADPTRRAILHLLLGRGICTAGQISSEFPAVSRAAISKHLGVLRESQLVTFDTSGRERHYALNAGPLAEVYSELSPFIPLWEASLQSLKRQVETTDPAEEAG